MRRLSEKLFLIITVLTLTLLLSACGKDLRYESSGESWTVGFAAEEIQIPETDDPLYIAGYNQGVEITGVRDLCRANALWLDTGEKGILLIGIDCIALSSGTVKEIRDGLKDFMKASDCLSVNVFSTHDHESVDTLGLWGPVGMDGKNKDYQKNLINAAKKAAENAYKNRSKGALKYGEIKADEFLRDSRDPQIYDEYLHQLRFIPDSSGQSIRVIFYSAHAESMRSENTLVSRDYPGVMTDCIKEKTGDEVLYVPGAIGGLIMTKELTKGKFDAEKNVVLTGKGVAEKALSIKEEKEIQIPAKLRFATTRITVPMDNPLFMYYRFLGGLDHDVVAGTGDTGYSVKTTVSLLMLDDIAVPMIPGELFPELLLGQALASTDPKSLKEMADDVGASHLLAVGLCNNELGYIVPPSYYLVNPKLPYLDTIKDMTGENHYEETNSVGKKAAETVSKGFEKLFQMIK